MKLDFMKLLKKLLKKSLAQRLIAGAMALAMLVTIILMLPGEAMARPASATGDVSQRIEQLRQRFPGGSFFTANGGRCYHAPGSQACDNCYLHNVMARMGYSSAMGNNSSWTCVSFARYAFWWIFGIPHNVGAYSGYIPAGMHSVSRAQARPGDMFIWNPGERPNITGGHMAIYLGYGRMFESNIGIPNQVSYGLYRGAWGNPSLILRANNFEEINNSGAPTYPTDFLGNGIYRIRSVGSPERILSVSTWDTPAINNNVTIFDDVNRYETQVWYAQRHGDAYVLHSTVYPLVLNAFSYTPWAGTAINIRPMEYNAVNQQWVLRYAGYGQFFILSAFNQHMALTIDSAENSARARMQVLDGGPLQRWIFEDFNGVINEAPETVYMPEAAQENGEMPPVSRTAPPEGANVIEGHFTVPNPVDTVTVELWRGSIDGTMEATYTVDITAENSAAPASFAFFHMNAGTYSLVFRMPGHTSFIINNIVVPVGGGIVQINEDERFPGHLPMYPGNVTGSGQVNIADLNIILNNWMNEYVQANITGLGYIDMADLSMMLANWMAETVMVD